MTEERKHSVRWEVGMFKTERVGETWGWGLKSRVLGNCQAEAGNLPHIWGQPELCRAVGMAWTSIDFQELGLIVTDTVWGHWRWHSRESGCVCELSVRCGGFLNRERLESWLRRKDHFLLLSRTWVQFLALRWKLTAICDSSSGGSDAFFWNPQVPASPPWCTNKHAGPYTYI